MKRLLYMFFLLPLLGALTACQQPHVPVKGFSLDRGAQLLIAGSPKSAIPFLTQTVAGVPDGPEPMALLSLAYALDMQDDRAISQAQRIHRPAGEAPGWEAVAVGIARMTQNREDDALESFQRVPNSALPAAAARQWMILTYLQAAREGDAIQMLEALATTDQMRITSMLWLTVIHEHRGKMDQALAALERCAEQASTASGAAALKGDLSSADAQTLYDAGIAAIAKGDLATAQALLSRVHEHTIDICDTPVWLALIAGIQKDWQTCRNQLADACENGSAPSRGLASELFSVVCALEDRPAAVVQYTLLGQRMIGRTGEPGYIHEQPKPEPVWGSDQMN